MPMPFPRRGVDPRDPWLALQIRPPHRLRMPEYHAVGGVALLGMDSERPSLRIGGESAPKSVDPNTVGALDLPCRSVAQEGIIVKSV